MNVPMYFNRSRKWVLLGLGLLVALVVVGAFAFDLILRREQNIWLELVVRNSFAVQDRVSELSPLREYRLEFDTAVTAESAGQAVHTVFAGEARYRERFREPSHLVEESWLPDTLAHETPDNRYAGLEPARLFREALEGFGGERRVALEEIASYPGFGEYSLAARAAQADLLSARFELPFPSELDYWKLPVPYASSVKDAAYAHVVRAGLAIADQRLDDAEEDIRTILSFGFLLIDEATGLFDTMAGAATLRIGHQALKEFLLLSGRNAEAGALPPVFAPGDSTNTPPRTSEVGELAFTEAVSDLYTMLGDSAITRGLRWQRMIELAYLPCETLTQLVLGPDAEFDEAFESARRLLVRRDSDAALFQLILETPKRAKLARLSSCAATM